MLHEIHRSVGFRPRALEGRLEDVSDVIEFVAPYSPEAVADVVGLPAERIARLAREFAAADGASIHVSTGLNMGRQGALAYWLVQMLLMLTGNLDRAGGNYFAARGLAAQPPTADRSVSMFETSNWGSFRRPVGFLPSAILPEFISDADEPLRAMIVVAGNPVLSIGGGEKLRRAFESLELLVTIDLYRNATGELADYVLPATDQFEREDINFFMQGFQSEPWLQWTPRVAEPDGEQREEWRILGELLRALGRESLIDVTATDPLATLFDPGLRGTGLSIDALREAGGVRTITEPGPGRSMQRLGLDGPIPCVPGDLRSTLERGHQLFRELRSEDPGAFKLITRRTRTTLNSTLQNLPVHGERSADPNPLWMHPDDGTWLGLDPESRVKVSNAHGAIETGVRFDARLRPGVVAMTHGFGNAWSAGMPRAQEYPGVNVNILSPQGPGTFDPVSAMSHLTGIPVEVQRV
jgi:anaerobic selenocysteine-containing dehydrogenase